jgi:hypothetical protein
MGRRISLPGENPLGGLGTLRALWQLLLESPSDLTCDECFAVVEYYAELLAKGSTDLLPEVIEHLKGCPNCEVQHREELRHLITSQSEQGQAGGDGGDLLQCLPRAGQNGGGAHRL